MKQCPECLGRTFVPVEVPDKYGGHVDGAKCPVCGGTGEVEDDK